MFYARGGSRAVETAGSSDNSARLEPRVEPSKRPGLKSTQTDLLLFFPHHQYLSLGRARAFTNTCFAKGRLGVRGKARGHVLASTYVIHTDVL